MAAFDGGVSCDLTNTDDYSASLHDALPILVSAVNTDLDSDGHGDPCDEDDDGDGVNDLVDNCPPSATDSPWNLNSNDQTDTDGDGIGDVCDTGSDDFDNDGIIDGSDNCPAVYNPTQSDYDTDVLGAAFDGGDAC